MQELEQIQKQLEEQQVNLETVNLLFLDLSSTCTGYAIAEVNFKNKSANFTNAGAIWFDKNWKDGQKYHYIYNSICNFFNIVAKVDFTLMESYSINLNQKSGCMVGPELTGSVKTALTEVGIGYDSIPPQSWRSALGIKPIITEREDKNGKKVTEKDYKTPARDKVEEYIKLPDSIISNITQQNRTVPDDMTDAICVGLGALTKLGFKKFNFDNIKFQENIDF